GMFFFLSEFSGGWVGSMGGRCVRHLLDDDGLRQHSQRFANGRVQKCRSLEHVKMYPRFLVAVISEVILDQVVVDTVLVFVVGNLNLVKSEIGRSFGGHAGTDDGDQTLALPLDHWLILQLCNLAFEPSDGLLNAIAGVKCSAQTGLPA